MTLEIESLRAELRVFARERDWEQFHSPKNLAMALAVESAEVLEHFQWLTEAESAALTPERKSAVAAELCDVLFYLVRLADRLDVDLGAASAAKLAANAAKYPVDRVRGSARKYDEY
jgi:dCTP diphosphatase